MASTIPRVRRSGPACQACVSSKHRCEDPEGDNSTACIRCSQKGVACMRFPPRDGRNIACDPCNTRKMKCYRDEAAGACWLCRKDDIVCTFNCYKMLGHGHSASSPELPATHFSSPSSAGLPGISGPVQDYTPSNPATAQAQEGRSELAVTDDSTKSQPSELQYGISALQRGEGSGTSISRSWKNICFDPSPQ